LDVGEPGSPIKQGITFETGEEGRGKGRGELSLSVSHEDEIDISPIQE
jgi:hypothetical protein